MNDILVAVNPFKRLPIYTKEVRGSGVVVAFQCLAGIPLHRLAALLTQGAQNMELYKGKKHADLPPHVFAISDSAFHNMLSMKKSQCAVIRYAPLIPELTHIKFACSRVLFMV